MMKFKYTLNPAKVGFNSQSVIIENVSYVKENENFIEVCYIDNDEDHTMNIKKDDILIYETY